MFGGAVDVVRPPTEKVAEVDDEVSGRRVDIDPGVVAAQELEAGDTIGEQQCEASIVAVGAAAELLVDLLVWHRRVVDHPRAEKGVDESWLEEVDG